MTFRVARPVVFPLHPIIDGACGCGMAGCGRIGKHPAVKWRDLEFGGEVPDPAEGAGYGLKTGAHPLGSDVFVVDLDGEEALANWNDLDADRMEDTFIVSTPRGWHIYFQHPGFRVGNSASEIGKGIDVRGDGGFVVGPGSPHRSGDTYEISNDQPIAPAPAWLLDWLKQRPAPAEAQTYAGDVPEGPERQRRRDLYAQWLAKDAPARGPERRGQGDKILFDVVQRGAYDLALPVADVLELVREHYDPRCSPMWGSELEERVTYKADYAKQGSERPAMPPLPADLAHLANAPSRIESALSALDDITRASRLAETSPAQETLPAEGPVVFGAWNRPVDPPVYLVDGLIPEGKVVTFFAEGGSLKTWAAFHLAISVAKGAPYLGVYPVQQGRTAYVDFEDGPYELKRRFKILTQNSVEDVPELGYWYGAPTLDSEEFWRALAPLNLKLIVIDALGSGMPADADENTTAFASAVKLAGRFTELSQLAGSPTVLFVHHANKTGGMRGTSAVRDQSDVAFRFEPVSENDNVKRMRMVCDKPGPQKRPPPVNVELSDAGLRTFVDEASEAGRNAKTIAEVEAAIKLALGSRSEPMTGADLELAVRGDNKRVREALRLLRARGEVRSLGKHEGLVLDDPDQRRARVLAAAPTSNGSAADLAATADVPTDLVEAMLRRGELHERVKGRPMGFLLSPSVNPSG